VDADATSLFRQANVRLLELVSRNRALVDVPFICECDDRCCFETVTLSAAEFEQVCVAGGFVTFRGHPVSGMTQPLDAA
jgi:hypothetical protein